MRLTVARTLPLVCALFAVVPATAGAATPPKVTSVAPLKLKIGDRMTIRGKGFLAGKNRNTVIFKATGARAVFVQAESATKTKLVVRVPAKLAPFLKVSAGQPMPTRFQLRVLARRLSPSYTPKGKSPVIAAAAAQAAAATPATPPAAVAAAAAIPAATATTPAAAPADCDHDGIADATDADDDNDLLPDATETTKSHTSPCNPDTDGDGVSDAFEYHSGYDLNGRALDYPVTGPYPNPNDPTDADADFDGDGLTMAEEYTLWKQSGGTLPLTYSDGNQDSPGTGTDVAPELDRDNNLEITDDEKDFDRDGLTNWEERHGMMLIGWWKAKFTGEVTFVDAPKVGKPGGAPLYETNWLIRDTDSDGLADGADDQDHDGFTNVDELDRSDAGLWVNPYNPCLPDPNARYCTLHPPLDNPWAPFSSTTGRPPSNPAAYDSDGYLVWPQP